MSGSPRRQPGRMGAHIEPFREMDCPTRGCGGWLGPWGYTTRRVRIALGQSEIRRQRRGYCRSCRRSHVLSDLFTYPHRLDTAATVTAALVAAAGGLGHRQVGACSLRLGHRDLLTFALCVGWVRSQSPTMLSSTWLTTPGYQRCPTWSCLLRASPPRSPFGFRCRRTTRRGSAAPVGCSQAIMLSTACISSCVQSRAIVGA